MLYRGRRGDVMQKHMRSSRKRRKDLVDKNISTMKSGRFNDNIEIYRLNKKSFMNGIVMWGVVFLFLCVEVVRSMNGKEFNLFAFWLLVLCCFMLFNSINGFMKWRKLELKK